MKRPFAVVGITYLIAQTVAVLCGFAVTAVLFCVALLGALSLHAFYKNRPAWLLPVVVSCTVSFGMSGGYHLSEVKPAQILQGQEVYITGKLCEEPKYSFGRYYYIVETDSVSLTIALQSVKFRLSSGSSLDADYGDEIRTTVHFNYIDRRSHTTRNLMAERVILTAYLPYDADPEIIDGGASLYGSVIKLRSNFMQAAKNLMGDELGGLLNGMFTGDTSGMNNVTLGIFRDCGLSHLFSVSGLHLSILISALTVLLRRIVADYRATALMAMPFVLFFMAFAGFSMSIRRAGIMTLLSLLAMTIKREADPLNSLGIAALGICLIYPCAAGDTGMLLSFASTLGLITLSKPVEQRLRSVIKFDPHSRIAIVLRPLINVLSTSVVAAVCTFPITVLCFGEMSLISPVANALCVYPASVFMITGAAASAISCIPIFGAVIGFILFIPAWFTGRLVMALCGLLSHIPGAGVSANYSFMLLFLLVAAGLLLLWFMQYRRENSRVYSLMLCAALIAQMFMCGVAVNNSVNFYERSIIAFSADGGIMTSLISGGQCVIVGAGGDGHSGWLASQKLSDANITDAIAVILPDNTDRCAENAVDIVEQYQPEMLFLSKSGRRYELIEQVCDKLDTQMYGVEDADFSAEGCDIAVHTFSDDNDMVWVWAECGELSMLVCPEGGDCSLVPEAYDAPDVALVSSEDIVNVTHIQPAATIISAGNSAGQGAEAILSYRGVENIFTIPGDGSIVVKEDGAGILIDEQ